MGDDDSVQDTYERFENGVKIPITRIKTDDFSKIYKAFQVRKRLIPSHLLRMFKEQLYEIVQSEDPTSEMVVAKMEEIVKDYSKVQFVAGIGVADDYRSKFGKVGLQGVGAEAIFRDIIFDDLNFDDVDILKEVVPELAKRSDYLPACKYMNSDLGWFPENMSIRQKNIFNPKMSLLTKYINKTYKKRFEVFKGKDDLDAIFECGDLKYRLNFLLFFFSKKTSHTENLVLVLKDLIEKNFEDYWLDHNNEFKKLICMYDIIVHSG